MRMAHCCEYASPAEDGEVKVPLARLGLGWPGCTLVGWPGRRKGEDTYYYLNELKNNRPVGPLHSLC